MGEAEHARHDPHEGMAPDGTIVTGARRDRAPTAYRPVLAAAIAAVEQLGAGASLYLYGSVATGTATIPLSDVDLVTIGIPEADAATLSRQLTHRFDELCRSVDVGAAQPSHYEGDDDEAYGNRAFLRHYCVHLAGPDRHSHLPAFRADRAAARGFNGDIAHHADRWRMELDGVVDPAELAHRIGRKTLFAVAGLVSVHDDTWTTDRSAAAAWWAELHPRDAGETARLLSWSRGGEAPSQPEVSAALEGVVAHIVDGFGAEIGLWAV